MAFDPDIQVRVINLDGSDDRMESARRQLETAGVPFQRYAAFDARGRDPASVPEYDATGSLAYMGRALLPGEIGCYMSHVGCLREFLATDKSHLVVLEDDAHLQPGFAETIAGIAERDRAGALPAWDIVNLGSAPRKLFRPLASFTGPDFDYRLVRAFYFPTLTTGLMWNRAGAGAYLDAWRHIDGPVDQVFRDHYSGNGRGLAFVPPVVTAIDAESDIIGAATYQDVNPRTRGYYLRKHRRQLKLYSRMIPNYLLRR